MDALNLLKQDHRNVEKLFQSWQRAAGATEQHEVCQRICMELTAHTQIEEQSFYPEVRSMAAELEGKVDESLREHGQVKQMCTRLQAMSAGDSGLATLVSELKQAVEHHVHEEEHEMFPKVRETCDQQWLLSLGYAMEQQKTAAAPGEQRVREDVRQASRTESRR